MAPELAEPYYLYGKALLELARAQSTVLGAGVPGNVATYIQTLNKAPPEHNCVRFTCTKTCL